VNRTLRYFVLTTLLLSSVAPCLAEESQGVRGRASLAGVLVEDVSVRAYPYRSGAFGPLTGGKPTGKARTATDGTYEISLPPGQDVVEALKGAEGEAGERPQTGDLHCLYSGSPVTVNPGAWTAVGLNLVTVPPEQRKASERAAITGRITRGGELAEKVYLYVYKDAGGGFRGPAHFLQPVAKGSFRLRMPPGTYFLVARKRARGGAYGPIAIGDWFNFYPRNPVILAPNEEVTVEIPLIERLSQLEEEPGAFQGVSLRIVDSQGVGQPGFYVLAYREPLRTGPPLATSAASDTEGRARLPLGPGQTAYLRARRSLGGPLGEGEIYADGQATGGTDPDLVLTLEASTPSQKSVWDWNNDASLPIAAAPAPPAPAALAHPCAALLIG
jgi:hypothetical protein